MNLKKDMQFLGELMNTLEQSDGILAIVLSDSRARGTHHRGSDFDIGLYYDSESPPNTNLLCKIEKNGDDGKQDNLPTPLGEWGPWINGGGWLKVKSMPVDLLYRDLARVRSVFQDCLNGQISIEYHPGHPHGFVNAIYIAEIVHCQVLWDRDGVISELKSKISP